MKKLVLDIGGSSIKNALMDDEELLNQESIPTPHDSLDSLMTSILSLVTLHKEEIDGIAISMPGNLDSSTGQIYTPGALFYNKGVNIIQELHKYTDLPVHVENDGKCAALAEYYKGNLQGCHSGVVLILGTGIGGGIIVHDKLVKGQHFFAGELSFVLESNKKKVLALTGSATALVHNYAKLSGTDTAELNGKRIFEKIEEGDENAKEALRQVAEALAVEIYNLQCTLDPDKFCIGGGISKQPLVIEMIQKEVNALYEPMEAMFHMPLPRPTIDVCKYYNDSNLIGAYYNFTEAEKK